MIKGALADHDLRYALTNELHARPFAVLDAPGRAVFLAIMPPSVTRRSALQLRLQQMVEGLSVVAISYYAVSLAGYLLAPLAPVLATRAGFDKTVLTALTVIPVVGLVWWSIRRLRKRIGSRGG